MNRITPKVWFMIAVVNFLLFCLISSIMGGDALNGHVRDREFFLGIHGHLTEVSRRHYVASLIWELATFGGLFGAWLLKRKDRRRL